MGGLGTCGCFSFNGNKMITTGGGGMIVTDDEALALRAHYLTNQAKDDPVEYVHDEIGFNYRLTNVQAAMGVAQLEVLDEYVEAKRRIAAHYGECLGGIDGISLPAQAAWAESVYWLYTVRVAEAGYGTDSRGLMHRLRQLGIQSRPLWKPLHQLKPYAGCRSAGPIDVAPAIHREALSIPCSVGLSPEDQSRVVAAIGGDPHSP